MRSDDAIAQAAYKQFIDCYDSLVAAPEDEKATMDFWNAALCFAALRLDIFDTQGSYQMNAATQPDSEHRVVTAVIE